MRLRRRLDAGSISVSLVLSAGVAALSALAGFSAWVAAMVVAVTLPVCCWACLTEP